MEKLPSEIALEIFYRLPTESVVLCKLVCKSWHNLLPHGDDGNCFANMHLRRRRRHHDQQSNLDNSTLNCITLQAFRDEEEEEEEEESVVGEFHITEFDDEVEGLNCKVKSLDFSEICISGWLSMIRLIGSCNGLLCLTITYRREFEYLKDRIGICNPLLHEYITFPPSDLQLKYDDCKVVIGFGHNPITDEYKLVRVCYRLFDSVIGDVEVYTLGKSNGMWRSIGTIRYRLRSWSLYVFINGSIHWLAYSTGSEQNIVSFDLEDEKFRVIPSPCNLNITNNLNVTNVLELEELRGCLCLIEETNARFSLNINLDIWVLKDYMNKESWVKEFRINWNGVALPYSPCAIKKKKDGDGDEILCWCNSKSTKTLASYDPKTRNFDEVGETQVVSLSQDPFLHINSLVSLKALGEDTKYAKNHPKTKA